MEPTLIYTHAELGPTEKSHLVDRLNGIPIVFKEELSEVECLERFQQATVAFGNVPADWLRKTEALQWLQLESAGFGEYQTVPIPDMVTITNLKGMFSVPAAETVLGGILFLHRGLNDLVVYQRQKHWVGADLRPELKLLQDQKAVIVGWGSIGKAIQHRLEAFGVEVFTMNRSSEGADLQTPEALDDLLPKMDLVIVCLPETQETIGFFDKARLSLLAEDALFVNVGRGSVVDEAALIDCLRANKLAGCVLDVTEVEPLPASSSLWNFPNVLLTQHTSGGSGNELMKKVDIFLDNLERFRKGLRLENVVDLKRGY